MEGVARFKASPQAGQEVTEGAAAAPVLGRFARLASFFGTGRRLTQAGHPTLADARSLVELLGLPDRLDPEVGGKVFRTRSAGELTELSFSITWAQKAGALRKLHGKLAATEGWAKLTDLERFRRAAQALVALGPLAARLVDPLGLAEAALPATDTATVLIGPRWPPPIRPVVPAGGRHGTSGPATSGGRPAPAGDEVLGVAMASPGASVGHLHWPTTVRSGVPMALQFQESADQTGAITIVMDDRAEVHDGSSFEAVVAATAAVGTAVLAEGRPILLRGAVPVRSIGPGRRAAEVLLDHLVLADVTDAGADTGARRLDHALGGRSDAIVVTSGLGARSLRAASGACLVVDGASWSMPHVLGAAPATGTSAPHVLA
jgi:hypothetical protein